MAKTGRKLKKIDPEQVKALALISCTYEEMSAVLKISRTQLIHRFRTLIKEGWEEGKMSLRREQYKAAMAGNTTMLVWLGKQQLGQADKVEQRNADLPPPERMNDSDLIAIATGNLPRDSATGAGAVLQVPAFTGIAGEVPQLPEPGASSFGGERERQDGIGGV